MVKRLLIVGAGEAGRMLAREVGSRARDQYLAVGFLDDAPALAGHDVDGLPVLGTTDALQHVVRAQGVDEVLIAVPSAGRDFVRRMVASCRDAGVAYRIAPGLLEIIKGPVHLEQIRDVRPEDLLGRETVEFDEGEIARFLNGRTVLVTGAGGSIGGEICRQVGRFEIERLVLLGRGENQIYEIERELRTLYPTRDIVPVIVDVRDADALARTFSLYEPEIVYHAAAHKHVHYMEAFPAEAVKNNILGTRNVIDAAYAAAVGRVVMLSTDKAARPGGVMGATKRLAEYLMAARNNPAGSPKLVSVRFGNVLASRGSVVPLFVAQIRAGGPVTVSHEDATRYFMSLKEACMLVIQASLMGEGGEIFILRMGEPIRIAELARDLIALSGHKAGDIRIEFTGLRPGEKLHESLVAEGEETIASRHENILRTASRVPPRAELDAALETLATLAAAGDDDAIRAELARIIADAGMSGTPRAGAAKGKPVKRP
ncbi:MAG TPA: nucleoside-diphosphate sugar epimerase/dehydratase [Candidatus Krumholzibacteria bacterium]|nr:nucleoside-diphosphate sugar epimerase/dehydratase [Candidatus Krumholzibacteria bacterium]